MAIATRVNNVAEDFIVSVLYWLYDGVTIPLSGSK